MLNVEKNFVGFIKGVQIGKNNTYLINGDEFILRQAEDSGIAGWVFWFESPNGELHRITEEYLIKNRFEEYPKIKDVSFTPRSKMWLKTMKTYRENILGYPSAVAKKTNLPRKVIFNDKKKATTLLYGNEATVVKACKGDKFDKEKGFLMAFFQKQTGLSKTQAKKYLKKITEEK